MTLTQCQHPFLIYSVTSALHNDHNNDDHIDGDDDHNEEDDDDRDFFFQLPKQSASANVAPDT